MKEITLFKKLSLIWGGDVFTSRWDKLLVQVAPYRLRKDVDSPFRFALMLKVQSSDWNKTTTTVYFSVAKKAVWWNSGHLARWFGDCIEAPFGDYYLWNSKFFGQHDDI